MSFLKRQEKIGVCLKHIGFLQKIDGMNFVGVLKVIPTQKEGITLSLSDDMSRIGDLMNTEPSPTQEEYHPF